MLKNLIYTSIDIIINIKSRMKRKQIKRRLPKDMFLKLRHGGPHATPKGKKGYNRKREKDLVRKELDVISFSQTRDRAVANYG
ncbi:MAG: hypothetical protein ACUZ8N_08210 [Candidatus Scalindua sp.]